MNDRVPGIFLLAAVFIIATCGLVYELLAASLSSYLLGGSVTQFSIVIGVFLTAMGIGSFLTRYVERDLLDWFTAIQITIGLTGGLSAAVLLFTFALLEIYLPILIGVLLVVGTLVGMEIPLLIRILQDRAALRLTVANVLALDYMGALIASVAFPLLFVPYLGLLRTSFLFGLLNIAVALVGLRALRPFIKRRIPLAAAGVMACVILAAGLAGAGTFTSLTEDLLYQDDIILTKQTPYQRLVLTRRRNDYRLFIDGNLQFSTVDEHRYHEALIHPAMAAVPHARRVLILGGGDGMAARELLKYPSVSRIDLVDLDPEMIRLFRDNPRLAELCDQALSNPRVRIHTEDAGKFLESSDESWDVIVLDLPDPNTLSLARLYTKTFYRLCAGRLASAGILVTQATSPFYAPEAFWCVVETLKTVPLGPEGGRRFHVFPYHVYVPSFGDWGFAAASRRTIDAAALRLPAGLKLKYLDNELLPTLFVFPADSLPQIAVEPNRLNDHVLTRYYRKGWRRYGP